MLFSIQILMMNNNYVFMDSSSHLDLIQISRLQPIC